MGLHYAHIDLAERRQIQDLVAAGVPVAVIARRLERHRSTVHREIGRNFHHKSFRDQWSKDYRGYYCLPADDSARRRRGHQAKLTRRGNLREHVVAKLRSGWSPQQIAGRLKHVSNGLGTVSHETIYQFVYGPEGRRGRLFEMLALARRRRRQRFGRKPTDASDGTCPSPARPSNAHRLRWRTLPNGSTQLHAAVWATELRPRSSPRSSPPYPPHGRLTPALLHFALNVRCTSPYGADSPSGRPDRRRSEKGSGPAPPCPAAYVMLTDAAPPRSTPGRDTRLPERGRTMMRFIEQQPNFDLGGWTSYRSAEVQADAAIWAAEIGAAATLRSAEMVLEASSEAMNMGYRGALVAADMTILAAVIAYMDAIASDRHQTRLEKARFDASVASYRHMQRNLVMNYSDRLGHFGEFIRLDDYDETSNMHLELTKLSMDFIGTVQVPREWWPTDWRDHALLGQEFSDRLSETRSAIYDLLNELGTYQIALLKDQPDMVAAEGLLHLMTEDHEVYNRHGLPLHEYHKVYDRSIHDAWRSAEGALDRLAGILKLAPRRFGRIFR